MIKAEGLQEVFNLDSVDPDKVIQGESVLVPTEPAEVPAIKADTELITPVPRVESSDYLKTKLKELVDLTKDALDNAYLVQQEDPSPRNTEAVSKMADTVAKTLQNLMQLEQAEKAFEYKKYELDNKKDVPAPVTNNLIVTTNDLIAKILERTRSTKNETS